MGMKSGGCGGGAGGGGEIVQVQGGHVVRSTGRKDRHSKVYTAKGPRDRRVRLSAHTAIQFYDVQDRLGYDRPSKAVDWLIKKAKSSIDKLAELPPWNPIAPLTEAPQSNPNEMLIPAEETEETESSAYNFHLQRQPHNDFPPSLVSNSSINFQNYPTQHHQDLGLSLHSFPSDTTNNNHQIQTLFSSDGGGSSVGFESSYQRMVAWSNENRGGDGGFVFNSHSESEPFGGTLQSSFPPSVSTRAWNHHLQIASQRTEQLQPPPQPMLHHSSIFGTRFGSSSESGLPVFCIPTRIQGDQVENGVVSDHPSSTSSPNSTHH